jgi:hypothetical protein
MKKPRLTCLIAVFACGTPGFAADNADRCAGARDLKLVNGKSTTR